MAVSVSRRGLAAAALFSLWLTTTPVAHGQPAPVPAPAEADLDPEAPLADLPDLGVAWPDLSKAPVEHAVAAAAVQRPVGAGGQ
jgi:translocation and assembly module TamA